MELAGQSAAITSSGAEVSPSAHPPQQTHPLHAKKRGRLIAGAVVLLFLLAAVALFLLKKAPPEAARLLPESDAIVYFNVGPLRTATRYHPKPIQLDPEYQHFVDWTGIQVERDLDQAAFALHSMNNPLGPNGPVAYSSIFVGKFDRQRLVSYLGKISESQERYVGHDIYSISIQGRTDRVVILDAETVAVSNAPSAEQIHSILDRQRTAFLPFTGNTILSRHYREVPAFSLAWGMGRLAAGLGDGLKIYGFRIPLSVDAIFVASLRWVGELHLRIEEIAPTGSAATLSADSVSALLDLAKTAENALPNAMTSAETKSLLNSATVEHHDDRAVLTAIIPRGILEQLLRAPETQSTKP